MKFSTYNLTECLSVIRSLNLLNPLITGKTSYFFWSGSHLLSHTVSSIVSSAVWVLTIVFGMCTGVSPKRIATRIVFTSWIHWKLLRNFCCIQGYWHNCYQVSLITQQWNNLYLISLERRWSSRTFRYGYLVTTSPQLPAPPSTAPSIKVGSLASGISDSHGVTGGVYKTRERIHRDILIRDY